MNVVGIDIGTYSLKAIHAKNNKGAMEVQRVVEIPNQLGISIPTDDVSKEKLSMELDTFFSDHALPRSDVRLALSESLVSTKVIQVPVLSDAELASAIGWQAEQNIPIPKDDLSLEYQVLYRPPKTEKEATMRVLLIGTRKSVVEKYVQAFTDIGIEPSSLETQTLALLRLMGLDQTSPVTLTAHMGFSTTDISISRQGELAFVFAHPQGGMLLTRALENVLQLPLAQAEEYKRTYGLDARYFEGKVVQALDPVAKTFVDTIQKAMHFYSSQYPQEKVERVLFSGGSAQLPGFVPYAASALGVEVLLVNPFANVQGTLPEANQAAFTICTGLALRSE